MTLSTSVETKTVQIQSFVYLCTALLTALVGAIYEKFSHMVYSDFMLYAFAIPLICGTFLLTLFLFLPKWKRPSKLTLRFWASAVAVFTVGSLMQGVLEIYGTTNHLMKAYPIVGVAFVVLAVVCYLKTERVAQ